jgi:transposase
MDHLGDVRSLDRRIKAVGAQIAGAVAATGTTLVGIFGAGPVIAGRILAEFGNAARFPGKDHFASYNGTAPSTRPLANSNATASRSQERRINHALHMAAVTQLRNPTSTGRDYYERKLAAAKTRKEALRCLKRRLSDVVFRQLVIDLEQQPAATNPTP